MGLAGIRIAVTRAREQAEGLMEALGEAGAEVMAFPLIRLAAAAEPVPLRRALEAGTFDWVVFSSANAVRFCALEAHPLGRSLADCLGGARIACVGPATAAAARDAGLTVDVIPETHVGDAVAPALAAAGMTAGARVLWPRSARARPVLAESLTAYGAEVTDAVAYTTQADRHSARALADALLQKRIEVVIFSSPSTVQSLHEVLPVMPDVHVAVIGPVTADAARAAGYPVDTQPNESTVAALVTALQAHFG